MPNDDKVTIAIVNTTDDVVFIINEECTACTDRKLGVVQRFQTTKEGMIEFLQKSDLIPTNGKFQFPEAQCKASWDAQMASLVCRVCRGTRPTFGKPGDRFPSVCMHCNSKPKHNGGFDSSLTAIKIPPYVPLKLPRKVNSKCDCN